MWEKFPDLAHCMTKLDCDDAAWSVTWHGIFIFGILFPFSEHTDMY